MKVNLNPPRLTCAKEGLEVGDPLTLSSSFAALLECVEKPVTNPGLNTSSRGLLTEGRVLWALSHPSCDVDTGAGGVGVTLMAAGVTLMGTGGGGAGGLVVLCLTGFEAGASFGSLDTNSGLRYEGNGFSPFSIDLIWLGVRD